MLPPKLKQLKENLERKGYNSRSSDEDKLLKELESIDKSLRKSMSDTLEFSEHVEKALAGPRKTCPCCGGAI